VGRRFLLGAFAAQFGMKAVAPPARAQHQAGSVSPICGVADYRLSLEYTFRAGGRREERRRPPGAVHPRGPVGPN
jgi:hypothetical protein